MENQEQGSFFDGSYQCDWCRGTHAEYGRFYVPAPDSNSLQIFKRGTFCTWECAAAYNRYRSNQLSQQHILHRHQLIQQIAGRTVRVAPPQKRLRGVNALSRNQWIQEARVNLTVQEQNIAANETRENYTERKIKKQC